MYSKETPNLKLPQWDVKDHPDFLTDMNGAYKKLDEFAGSMDYINEPLIKDLISGQDKLKEDVAKAQSDIGVIDEEVHELQEKVPVLEDRIQHEHEKNDEQDLRLKNLETDLHAEEVRAEAAEEALGNRVVEVDNKVSAEVTRATQAEGTLRQSIVDEAQRATRVEDEIRELITQETTRANTAEDELNAKHTALVGDVDTLTTSLDTLSTRVGANSNSITALDNRVEALEDVNNYILPWRIDRIKISLTFYDSVERTNSVGAINAYLSPISTSNNDNTIYCTGGYEFIITKTLTVLPNTNLDLYSTMNYTSIIITINNIKYNVSDLFLEAPPFNRYINTLGSINILEDGAKALIVEGYAIGTIERYIYAGRFVGTCRAILTRKTDMEV